MKLCFDVYHDFAKYFFVILNWLSSFMRIVWKPYKLNNNINKKQKTKVQIERDKPYDPCL